ncbi:trypsin-like peptidase domain-containing protein [Candidatus Saccharibacteria bacterium]|nr:trypsin-like peptidase domain-containing protein [Candidatus Saccharibacteria bacterium]
MADEVKNQTRHSVSSGIIVGFLFFSFVAGFVGATLANYLNTDTKDDVVSTQKEVVLQEGELIANVAEDLSPSVVSITAKSNTAGASPFSVRPSESAGTGLIVTKEGIVITNKHVIPGSASAISIITSDGTKYEDVSVIDRDTQNDVAFLKINKPKKLKAAKLGDSSDVRVGERVIAIGNALGRFNTTVTSGIVSGLGRPITASDGDGRAENLDNLLQTDASINPGNSGGPLVNINGEVIGINTAIAGNAENIGFAIPINDIRPLFDSVLSEGRIIRPYLGVNYIPLNKQSAQQLDLKVDYGAYVATFDGSNPIISGSPAEKSGIKNKDVILSIDGKKINENDRLSDMVASKKVGSKVKIELLRDGKKQTVIAKLEEADF